MKEIQAQLNDFKKCAETAEAVAREAESQVARGEENLRVEKENAAKAIADVYRKMREDDDRTALENVQQMKLDNLEQHTPAGQSNNDIPMLPGRQSHPREPGPWRSRVEKEDIDSSDFDGDQHLAKVPLSDTRAITTPRLGFLAYAQSPGPSRPR